MPANASEWDARHRGAADEPLQEPATVVSEWLQVLPEGPALDIACGTGRHALLLAARGHAVTAVDWSAVALDILERRARAKGMPIGRSTALEEIAASEHGIHTVQANLEAVQLAEAAFAVIVCVQYLQRSLFPQIERALLPSGVLLFETFTRAQLDFAGGPRNPAYLLEPKELRSALPRLDVLFYQELNAGQGIASLVARKPAEPNVPATPASAIGPNITR